jgi:sugar-specific transcriptional regulator TrmB
MKNQELLEKLVEFGMTERQAKLYIALLSKPESRASELHRTSGVLRSKTYEILHQMVAKGYCTERVEGRNRYYKALKPELLFEMMQNRQFELIREKRDEIEELFTEIKQKEHKLDEELLLKKQELENRHKEELLLKKQELEQTYQKKKDDLKTKASITEDEIQKHLKEKNRQLLSYDTLFRELEGVYQENSLNDRTLDFIEVINQKEQIHKKYVQLVKESEKEIVAFCRPPTAGISKQQEKEQIEAQDEFMNKGGCLGEIIMDHPEYEDTLTRLLDLGTQENDETRIAEDLPVKMFIFDQKKVMLAIPAIPGLTESDFTMVIIDEPGFAKLCTKGYEYYWNKSKTPEEFHNSKLNSNK